MATRMVNDTGITVVYEPEGPSPPIVDIVFVHGLQGHPRGTWTKGKIPKSPHDVETASDSGPLTSAEEKRIKRGSLAWISKKLKRRSLTASHDSKADIMIDNDGSESPPISSLGTTSRNTTNISTMTTAGGGRGGVFWPADLLPRACPRARILAFGYDTKITNYGAASINKNSIYSHSKDLLFALSREIEGCVDPSGTPRQIIFVAHSLGGIVVKEMLSRSSMSTEARLTRIVESTLGVIFLGTPHRGSPDFAAAGDWARTFVSFFGAETSPAILHALGLRTTDLERAQEAFSGLWLKYNFRVKTFQEGLGLTGMKLGALGGKVVPDYSSSLGDMREHAETIQANHREMCRFSGADDPGYRQVSGELLSIYLVIEKNASVRKPAVGGTRSLATCSQTNEANNDSAKSSLPATVNSFDLWGIDKTPFTETEETFLTTLWFPNMNSRRRVLATPADGTCNWLFHHPSYTQWILGEDQESHDGLLQIKGTPGSGKSVLAKEAYRRALREHGQPGHSYIAAFFFNGNGTKLEKTREGLLRCLLYQLLPQDREQLSLVARSYAMREPGHFRKTGMEVRRDKFAFKAEQLEHTLRSFLLRPRHKSAGRTIIFIDALDECVAEDRMKLCNFLGTTSRKATKLHVNLNIFTTSRNFPSLTVGSRPSQLNMNNLNQRDIRTYVEQRLQLGIASTDAEWIHDSERIHLRDSILERSRGIFLWVVLAVDGVIELWHQGASPRQLHRHLKDLPEGIHQLYTIILRGVPGADKEVALRLFQWALLSTRPFLLREWHEIMSFISWTAVAPPRSLKECQESESCTTTDEQLVRKIRALSKGLLDVAVDSDEGEDEIITGKPTSQFAGAGSFMMNPGETRIIQPIHESLIEYFKNSTGFRILSPPVVSRHAAGGPITILGHIAIMTTCLDYLEISELDALVFARIKAAKRERNAYLMSLVIENLKNGHGEEDSIVSNDMARDNSSYESPIGPDGVDIGRWLSGIIIPGNSSKQPTEGTPTSSKKSDERLSRHQHMYSASIPDDEQSKCSLESRRLEVYPALLHYATDEFFTHARCFLDNYIRYSGASSRDLMKPEMEAIVKRLCDKTFKKRWLALREELHVIYPVDGSMPLSFSEYLMNIDNRFKLFLSEKEDAPQIAPSPLPSPDIRSLEETTKPRQDQEDAEIVKRTRTKLRRLDPKFINSLFSNTNKRQHQRTQQHEQPPEQIAARKSQQDPQDKKFPVQLVRSQSCDFTGHRRTGSVGSLHRPATREETRRHSLRDQPQPFIHPFSVTSSIRSRRSEDGRPESPGPVYDPFSMRRRGSVVSFQSAASRGSRDK